MRNTNEQVVPATEKSKLVLIENGQPVTNSLLVAEKFNKQHKHVLDSIKKLTAENSAVLSMFVDSSYLNEQGKQQPMYIMNRDGFSLLVMGFTGKKAMAFKLEYIEAFNKMEQTLKQQTPQLSTIDILKLTVQSLDEQQKQLEEVKRDVREIRAAKVTSPDYFTIAGYAKLNGFQIGLHKAKLLGIKAAAHCRREKIETETIPDPRFGRVKLYPTTILKNVFTEHMFAS